MTCHSPCRFLSIVFSAMRVRRAEIVVSRFCKSISHQLIRVRICCEADFLLACEETDMRNRRHRTIPEILASFRSTRVLWTVTALLVLLVAGVTTIRLILPGVAMSKSAEGSEDAAGVYMEEAADAGVPDEEPQRISMALAEDSYEGLTRAAVDGGTGTAEYDDAENAQAEEPEETYAEAAEEAASDTDVSGAGDGEENAVEEGYETDAEAGSETGTEAEEDNEEGDTYYEEESDSDYNNDDDTNYENTDDEDIAEEDDSDVTDDTEAEEGSEEGGEGEEAAAGQGEETDEEETAEQSGDGMRESTERSDEEEAALPAENPAEADPEAAFPAQTFDGSDGNVLVHAEVPEGALPEGTEMTVTAVSDRETISNIRDAMEEPDRVSEVHAVDITFKNATGEAVEPLLPITVAMSAEPKKETDRDPVVVHMDDDGYAEQVEDAAPAGSSEDAAEGETAPEGEADTASVQPSSEAAEETAAATEMTFEASSFSVYALVYTVDFTFDGYKISIPGGSSILFSKLAEELALGEKLGNGAFSTEEIEKIEFTNPDLVRLTRIEKDTNVNDLLTWMQDNGTETWLADGVIRWTGEEKEGEFPAETDVEQMDNDAPVSAGDWMLTSLEAFSSEETLTIVMKNGDRFVVGVTDLDQSQNGRKPGTIDTVDTIAEGITITMFDYGPEKLDNVNNTYKSTDNSGINNGHLLKFYSYGTEGSTINNFTGGAYAMQGIVQSTTQNGYPVAVKGNQTENLEYLFGEGAANGKTVYTGVNKLFKRDAAGNLVYDSDQNYAYMNPNTKEFTVYNDTYLEEGADYDNPFRIGFFPYNDYDNRYQCIHGNNFNWGCKGSKDWRVRDQVGHYNHHFGMKVEGRFYMTDNKKAENGQDMIFHFSGDDDMWVFVDGVLVLDIGGVHNPVSGDINFTTGQVTVSAAKTASDGTRQALGTNTTIAEAFRRAGKTWDDSPLSQHDIQIFYMERGGMYSNLAVTMNLPTFPAPKEVFLNKVDAQSTQATLSGAQFELFSDEACTNPVKDQATGSVTVIESEGDPNKGRVRISNLIPGQTYYFKEVKAPAGYKLDNRVFKIEVPANDTDPAKVYLLKEGGATEEITPSGDPARFQITNEREVFGGISFTKIEKNNASVKLEGAQFTIYEDADCRTVAKDKNGADLIKDSDGNGVVSFADMPAGRTYYMKETREPAGYFPSSDVYRVELDAAGNGRLYKGSEEITGLQIENEPKQKKTSISVEKQWSDGSENHKNDTVKVQLYDDPAFEKVSGGSINITVKADQWVDYDHQDQTVDAPASGSISFVLEKSTDGGNIWVQADTGTLSPESWSKTFENLPEMEDGKHILYRVVRTEISEPIKEAAISAPENGIIDGADNGEYTVSLIGKVAQSTAESGLTFDASAVNASGNWQVQIGQVVIRKDDGQGHYNENANDAWSINSFSLTPGNNKQHYDAPDSPADKTNCAYTFAINLQGFPNGQDVYIRITPSCYFQGDNTPQSVFTRQNGGNAQLIVPAGADSINVEISSTPFTANSMNPASFSARPNRLRSVNVNTDSGLLETGEKVEGSPVAGTEVTLQDGKWTHTWSGLLETENNIDVEGYTGTLTHHYYVKEIEVNLADGDDESAVTADYKFIYNTPGDPNSGIKTVVIENTVPERTGLEVTKEWRQQDGTPYVPKDSEKTITFDVYRIVDGVKDDKPVQSGQITYAEGSWSTCTFENLPTQIKVGDELKDVKYYVVETSPAGNDKISTFYRASDGTEYAAPEDAAPEDAAGSQQETIVNVNSRREINITKKWYIRNGSSVKEAAEPTVKEIWFKLKKVNKATGEEIGWYDGSTGQAGAVATGDGTVFKLKCSRPLDPETQEPGDWTWNVLTFTDLPTDVKYYIVETDKNGTPLAEDTVNQSLEIDYADENGKEVGAESPFDAAIPGSYVIKNTEKHTSLYAEKIWHTANKDNLVGTEPVWFRLMRIETDDAGNYYGTPEEVQKFSLKEGTGWAKYFPDIQTAPVGQTGSSYHYYQYFAIELGLLKSDTANLPDDQKVFEPISNLYIKYQSRGSGTVQTTAQAAEDRDAYLPYSDGADGPEDVTTAEQWSAWLSSNDVIKIRTWDADYDGNGYLGIFNSSEKPLEKRIEIRKEWKHADGTLLSPDEMAEINASAGDGGDQYTVEIQLMQRADDIKINKDDVSNAVEGSVVTEYGSTFSIGKDKVIMQSDSFEVVKTGENDWTFEIPATNSAGDYQLPLEGPFQYNGQTYHASFTYYIAEYRVYNKDGREVTTNWTAACLTDKDNTFDEYGLILENRQTTDLTLHKKWEGIPETSRSYVDENVKALLFKVYRKEQNQTDEQKTDITEWIGRDPEAYGLSEDNVFETSRTVKIVGDKETEVDPSTEPESGEVRVTYYQDYVRIDIPKDAGTGKESWGITDSDSADALLKIVNLDAHERNFVADRESHNAGETHWPTLEYWTAEEGYLDAEGTYHPISDLLHGNAAAYPKYETSVTGADHLVLCDPATTCSKIALGAADAAHLGSVNTLKGVDLTIYKTDTKGNKLKDAEFRLLRKTADGGYAAFAFDANDGSKDVTVAESQKGVFTITDKDKGYFIKNLTAGTYKLEETKAPAGFIKVLTPTEFVVKHDGTVTAVNGDALPSGDYFTFEQAADTEATGNKHYKDTVKNEKGASLPSTGGPGTDTLYFLGMMLLSVPGALMYFRQRTEQRQ